MSRKAHVLVARVSTESPRAIGAALRELLAKGSVRREDDEFFVHATLRGDSARDLNTNLLSALRRVERRTRLRAEWTSGGTTERFFDYVSKGSRAARATGSAERARTR
jgi:hypothetical protein